jgi:hypothetical protein
MLQLGSLLLGVTAFTLLFLLAPSDAYAWGPGTHLQVGSQVLENLAILSPALQELLRRFPYDFLYGCIGADITVGKKYRIKQVFHCHNWSMGFRLLDAAETPHESAFAYGYLCHLAADTISHNYFVPCQEVASYSANSLRHAYWEVRFDDFIDPRMWPLARVVHDEAHGRNDGLLQRVLADTLFSFRTNKRIFTGLISLQQVRHWRKMVTLLAARSSFPFTHEDFDRYYRLTQNAVFAFMIDGQASRTVDADPIGRRNLHAAALIRKTLRTLTRRRVLSPAQCEEIVREVTRSLESGLDTAFREPELLSLPSVRRLAVARR